MTSTAHADLTGANLHNVKQHNHDADTEAGGGKLSGAVTDTYMDFAEGAAPGTPASGHSRLYVKTDGSFYQKDDAGNETNLASGGGGGGAPDSATYWVEDANGSLTSEVVVGTTGITQTAHASRQAAAKAGRLHFPTDAAHIARDDGSGWDPYGPAFLFTPPPIVSTWTWINQGSASATDAGDAIQLVGTATSTASLRILKRTAPATPYTITAAFLMRMYKVATNNGGLCWRQSSDGKVITFPFIGNNGELGVTKYNSPTSANSNYTYNTPSLSIAPMLWLRIADNGTNRICSWSPDGQNWLVVHTIGRTDFMTADEVGFYVDAQNASLAPELGLHSWKAA